MEMLFALLGLCEGNRSLVDSPHKGPEMQPFDVFFIIYKFEWGVEQIFELPLISDAMTPM